MSAVVLFPHRPIRAVYIYPKPGEGRAWVARFAGDRFTAPFCMEGADRWCLLPDVQRPRVRRGLPIVDLTRKDLRAAWRSPPPDLAAVRHQARNDTVISPRNEPPPGGWAA